MALKTIDLFSGIGGISLALQGIAVTSAYCECDRHAIAVLRSNIRKKKLHDAPICDDVRAMTMHWMRKNGCDRPDLITAGFPCIGFSIAGKRLGFDNEQTALFHSILNIIDVLKKNRRSSPIIF